MPGIVNIHTNVGGTLFKGLTEDIKGAFYGLAFPMERFITRESMYSISMLGAMEAVKFGSTFIDDLYHFPESTARAAEELGLTPCLHLGMRLGEGSGCPLLFRVLEGACGVMRGMATFDEASIEDGYLDEIRAMDAFTVEAT